ncbi:MAG: hypothetical protein GY750_02480 [Lentisphaerae bacterium]|nr:hypothetical protein [Lentisphaerota bacterium]MCP4100288.1 hypothetical protein [Lentisphaerota bacterium]
MKVFAKLSALLLSVVIGITAYANDSNSAPDDLFTLVESLHGKAWSYSPKQFAFCLKNRRTFSWTSKQHNTLRYAAVNRRGLLLWDKMPIFESLLRFKQKKLNHIFLSLYNKADIGICSKSEYASIIKKAEKSLDKIYGTQTPKRTTQNIGGIRIYSRVWQDKTSSARLSWSYSGSSRSSFKPEYVNIAIQPKAQDSANTVAAMKVNSKIKDSLPDKVKKNNSGDIFIPLPMVDQGQRGYCVVASLTRILKYYDSGTDQHMLAALAKTDASRGTTLDDMENALRKAGLKLRFYSKEICERSLFRKPKNLLAIISKYNKIAKKTGKPKLREKDYIRKQDRITFLLRGRLLSDMDEKTFVAACMKDQSGYRSFRRNITSAIDAGTPVLWAVQLGVI